MAKGRPLSPLSLSAEDRAQLVAWSKRPKTAQALAMRSRVVLLAAGGHSNTAIAGQLLVTLHTVGKWRQRYLDMGLDGLVDEPRPGTSRKLSDQDVEQVLALTLESIPADATHWSTRSLAKRTGLSRDSPHLAEVLPGSASFRDLQVVERPAVHTDKQLRRGVHRSTKELETAIRSFIQSHNRNPKPFIWHKTADQILDSVARFCARTLETGH
jgi:transposase